MNAPRLTMNHPPQQVLCNRESALEEILTPRVNLITWMRTLTPSVSQYCQQLAAGEERSVQWELQPDISLSQSQIDQLPEAPGRTAFLDDVLHLARLFGRLTGQSVVTAKLSTVHQDACRKFHADRVGLRAVCTYAGPGTQWVNEDDVHRAAVSRPAPGLEPVRPNAVVFGASSGDVVFMKGEGWPENQGRGAVHRSPPIAASQLRRWVLILDEPSRHTKQTPLRLDRFQWETMVYQSGCVGPQATLCPAPNNSVQPTHRGYLLRAARQRS